MAFAAWGSRVSLFDPEETRSNAPRHDARCEVCSDALPATRYVHVEGRAIHLACSEACLRGLRRAFRRARWSARRRAARRV
ncbi:MAG TPA: hypothetical protein VHO06_02135, partial [Polyangia bacterium]|nr:hypothetical protein [Polyangia bacterium]